MVKRSSENGMITTTRSLTEMATGKRLLSDFYFRDVLLVAPELPGKILVIRSEKWDPQKVS